MSRYDVAIHEAGHAVIAAWLGLGVYDVSVFLDDEGDWQGRTVRQGATDIFDELPVVIAGVVAEVLVTTGGYFDEVLFLDALNAQNGDCPRAIMLAEMCEAQYPRYASIAALLASCGDGMANILGERWTLVEAVAAEL